MKVSIALLITAATASAFAPATFGVRCTLERVRRFPLKKSFVDGGVRSRAQLDARFGPIDRSAPSMFRSLDHAILFESVRSFGSSAGVRSHSPRSGRLCDGFAASHSTVVCCVVFVSVSVS